MQMQKINSNMVLKLIFSGLVFVSFILAIAVGINAVAIKNREEERLRIQQDAGAFCGELFSEGVIKEDVSKKDLDECKEKLDLVYDQTFTEDYRKAIKEAVYFLDVKNKINTFFDGQGILKEEITDAKISDMEYELQTLKIPYQKRIEAEVSNIREEFNRIEAVKAEILGLFVDLSDISDYENAEVVASVNREQYNQALATIETIAQPNLKNILTLALKKVDSKVSEDERIYREKLEAERRERERILREQREAEERRQAEIAAAWHIINVPYISQRYNEVFNGCEAASLLMSLQYKGLLSDKSLRAFAEEMPKSNDPSTGFYLDIYNFEPRSESHWIDSAPLAEYGNKSSNSNIVRNLRGNDFSVLKDEIMNDNPVVIYLTYNFNDLKEIVNGVPLNLHVMVLSGYNHITNEYQITDPWTRTNGQYVFTVAGSRIRSLYDQVGRRAIAIGSV